MDGGVHANEYRRGSGLQLCSTTRSAFDTCQYTALLAPTISRFICLWFCMFLTKAMPLPIPPVLHHTTSKSHIGELAPMALCDIHVAGCGEHLPAWGLRDDRIPGTAQAVRGGRHGQRLHYGFPSGRWMPAAVQMPVVVRMPACHSRRFKGKRQIGAATG